MTLAERSELQEGIAIKCIFLKKNIWLNLNKHQVYKMINKMSNCGIKTSA